MEDPRKFAGRLVVADRVKRRGRHDSHRPPRMKRQRSTALRRARGSEHLLVAARATNLPRASWFRVEKSHAYYYYEPFPVRESGALDGRNPCAVPETSTGERAPRGTT